MNQPRDADLIDQWESAWRKVVAERDLLRRQLQWLVDTICENGERSGSKWAETSGVQFPLDLGDAFIPRSDA